MRATMADWGRKGDGEQRGIGFRHPQLEAIVAMRVAEQIQIPALHESETRSHQTDCAVSQIVRLPAGPGGHARYAEQSPRNHPIRFAGKTSIERAQGQRKPTAALQRETMPRAVLWLRGRKTPQEGRRIGAGGKIGVKGDDGRRRRCNAYAADEESRHAAAGVIDKPILTLAAMTGKRWDQSADGPRLDEELRRRRDDHGRGVEMRQPDEWRLVGGKLRVNRESAIPTVLSIAREDLFPDCA